MQQVGAQLYDIAGVWYTINKKAWRDQKDKERGIRRYRWVKAKRQPKGL